MERLNVFTEHKENSVILRKGQENIDVQEIEIDFTDCPDIAQTLAVICAAKGIRLILTGVESLKIKETDRLAALKNELKKFNIDLNDLGGQKYEVSNATEFKIPDHGVVSTYKDHRMAMAFAPLSLLGIIRVENKDIVVKSYPSFWIDLSRAGFDTKEI